MNFYLITNIGTFMGEERIRQLPYHLVLAQVLETDSTYYGCVLKVCREREVILDNGAYEGIVFSPDKYLEMALDLKPWCVVLPDLVGEDAKLTRKLSIDFSLKLPEDQQVMYVPQGRTPEEVLDEYDWAVEHMNPDLTILGIGKSYLLWGEGEDARSEMLDEIAMTEPACDSRYHILGARWVPTKTFAETYIPVIGIDTMKPCACALAGIVYPDEPTEKISHLSPEVASWELLCMNTAAFCTAYGAIEG